MRRRLTKEQSCRGSAARHPCPWVVTPAGVLRKISSSYRSVHVVTPILHAYAFIRLTLVLLTGFPGPAVSSWNERPTITSTRSVAKTSLHLPIMSPPSFAESLPAIVSRKSSRRSVWPAAASIRQRCGRASFKARRAREIATTRRWSESSKLIYGRTKA